MTERIFSLYNDAVRNSGGLSWSQTHLSSNLNSGNFSVKMSEKESTSWKKSKEGHMGEFERRKKRGRHDVILLLNSKIKEMGE